jgi:hypothetical protein
LVGKERNSAAKFVEMGGGPETDGFTAIARIVLGGKLTAGRTDRQSVRIRSESSDVF